VLKTYENGDILQAQNDPIEKIALITSGCAIGSLITIDGAEVWIADYKVGDWIGLHAGRSGLPSLFEVRAVRDVELLCLSPDELEKAMTVSITLRRACDSYMLAKFESRTRQLIEARTLSAKGRICSELKRLSHPIGIDAGRYVVRPTPIFSELAFRVGSTRETVSRLVSDLERRNVLIRRPGALVISDMARFEAFIT
jgi:CRP-like cAMP-binding protein